MLQYLWWWDYGLTSADIQEADSEPPVSRTEYDLKDQMIRNSIMNTEDKVEKLEEKVDDIKEDTRSINKTLLI